MSKDTQPLYGEEMPLRPPQRWHDAIRSLPGEFMEEGVFETLPDFFDTPESEYPFMYFLLSVDRQEKYIEHFEPGIYLGATIAPDVFEEQGHNTFQGLENELMFLLLKNSKPKVTTPLEDVPMPSDGNSSVLENPQNIQIDLGNTVTIEPYSSFDISKQTEIPYEFMTYYRIFPISLRSITDIISDPNTPKSLFLK